MEGSSGRGGGQRILRAGEHGCGISTEPAARGLGGQWDQRLLFRNLFLQPPANNSPPESVQRRNGLRLWQVAFHANTTANEVNGSTSCWIQRWTCTILVALIVR